MIDFSKAPACYWSTETKMSYLQRRIIIYSVMYYIEGVSLISDHEYDEISQQLAKMKECDPISYSKTKYFYAMPEFDGSTGFYIFSALTKKDQNYLMLVSKALVKQRGLK